MAFELTRALAEEYAFLFAQMTIREERRGQVRAIHERIRGLQPQYRNVEAETRVPWFVVAIIHNLEASLRMDRHLHNGDRLTGRTIHIPAGRPVNGSPPFSWEQSAIDALRLHNLHNWNDWEVPGIAFVLERYNGTGYRSHHPHVKSPYLWSFSNIYARGKYIADGQFSETAVSEQCGGMVLLRYLLDERVPDVDVRSVSIHAVGEEGRTFPRVEGVEGDDEEAVSEITHSLVIPYPGRYLSKGVEKNVDVEWLQLRLKDLGLGTGSIDGDFGEVTENAVRLFQARSVNAAGEPLEVDGVVGRETWSALFGETSVEAGGAQPASVGTLLGTEAVRVASEEVGVRERPLGSNRGPRVDQYIAAIGLNPARDSYPWCVCFIYWCFQVAAENLGVRNPCPRNASVHMAWNACRQSSLIATIGAAQAQRDPSLVRPGMIFFIDAGGGKGHAGIIASIRDGMLETIEGNTNDNGSREGIGVFRRASRRIKTINLGFAEFA